jgi:hypothetical protein
MLQQTTLTESISAILNPTTVLEGLGGGGSPQTRKMLEAIFNLDEVEQGTFIRDLARTLGAAKFKKLCAAI